MADELAAASAILYLASTGALGVAMLRLFLRQAAPAGLLATALLMGALPIYASALLIAWHGAPPSQGPWQLAYAMLLLGSGVAAACVMRFTTEVFRPRSRWLPRANASLAGVFALGASIAPFHHPEPLASPLAIACASGLVAVLSWTAFESFGHWAMYRRAEGLDPLVVARFRLWGIAALANVFAVPLIFLAADHLPLLAAGAGVGLVSTLALWLAFLPPASYVRRARMDDSPTPRPGA